jgi:hypothetical protein
MSFDLFNLVGHLLPSAELVDFATNLADSFWTVLGSGDLRLGMGGIWREMTCHLMDPIAVAFTNHFQWLFMIFGTNC